VIGGTASRICRRPSGLLWRSPSGRFGVRSLRRNLQVQFGSYSRSRSRCVGARRRRKFGDRRRRRWSSGLRGGPHCCWSRDGGPRRRFDLGRRFLFLHQSLWWIGSTKKVLCQNGASFIDGSEYTARLGRSVLGLRRTDLLWRSQRLLLWLRRGAWWRLRRGRL